MLGVFLGLMRVAATRSGAITEGGDVLDLKQFDAECLIFSGKNKGNKI